MKNLRLVAKNNKTAAAEFSRPRKNHKIPGSPTQLKVTSSQPFHQPGDTSSTADLAWDQQFVWFALYLGCIS